MNCKELSKELSATSYLGRGIVLGRHPDGETAVMAYFIMGRSENSRNRVFVTDGDGIKTKAFDESKMTDPSLIIYAPVRVVGETTIVTNGDQTDTIYEALDAGRTVEDALRRRTFEPDAPNYTPRISGVVNNRTGDYQLSILKSADGNPEETRRYFFDYTAPQAGQGHFIHTYQGDGDPLPSFEGEPAPVTIEGDIDAFTRQVWDSLDEQNKVSLFVRFLHIPTGKTETRIINKHQ